MSVGEAFKAGMLEQLDNLRKPVDEAGQTKEELRDPRNTADYMQRVKMFAKLELLRRDLEDSLKECKAQAEKIGGELLEDFAEAGVTSINAEGLSIYQKKTFYVSKRADKDGATNKAVCEALKSNGMGFLVQNSESYAASTLKAHIAEMLSEEKEVPQDVAKLLNIGEKIQLTSAKRG